MEAPEYAAYEMPEEPVYTRRRTAGVLAERPPLPGEPGVPRKVLVFGGAVLAVIAFLALAVLATRDGGDGTTTADARDGDEPGATPGTVIAVGGAAGTATAASASASATASTAASVTASPSTTTSPAATLTPGAATTATAGAGTTTPTPTATSAPPTAAPTATPTQAPPTPTPTVYVPPPHPSTLGACDLTKEAEKCGSANVRVICFPPFGSDDPQGFNDNWFVDVTGSYPLQPGWRETTVFAPVSIGPVIKAGQYGC
jgi:hypothetical protein